MRVGLSKGIGTQSTSACHCVLEVEVFQQLCVHPGEHVSLYFSELGITLYSQVWPTSRPLVTSVVGIVHPTRIPLSMSSITSLSYYEASLTVTSDRFPPPLYRVTCLVPSLDTVIEVPCLKRRIAQQPIYHNSVVYLDDLTPVVFQSELPVVVLQSSTVIDVEYSKSIHPFAPSHIVDKLSSIWRFDQVSGDRSVGVLLSGPPGVGKTASVKQFVLSTGSKLFYINSSELISEYSGESEAKLDKLFRDASKAIGNVVVFIDEIDRIAAKRQEHNTRGVRLVVTLLTLMDGVGTKSDRNFMVIGATTEPNSLDPAIRRPGRFDNEIELQVPTELERSSILVDFGVAKEIATSVATKCSGFVGADLKALVKKVALLDATLSDLAVFQRILATMSSTSLKGHGVYIEQSSLSWDDVGGASAAKTTLKQLLGVGRLGLKRLGLSMPRGILLFGPPGTGKTRLAKCASVGMSFMACDGASLYSSLVGEAEANIRRLFSRGRANSPCIIFIDEVEALVGKRGDTVSVQERVLATFLNEMDGLDSVGDDVVVLASTNYPENLDAAMLRPGRFDHLIYVGAPGVAEREAIFQVHSRGLPLDPDVDLPNISNSLSHGYSGADIEMICRDALFRALRSGRDTISPSDFSNSISTIKPSISRAMEQRFLLFSETAQ